MGQFKGMGNLKEVADGNQPGHKGGFPRWIFLLIGILVVVGLSLWLWLPRPASGSGLLPEVKVALVDTTRLDVYEEFDGSIRASQAVEVTARVEGILEKMLFREGSYVRKGQTLFVIDPRLYQAQVDRARAQLDRAKALKNKADRDLSRIRPLFTQKAASQLDLDNAEAAVECAEADVEICRVDLLESQITLGYTRVVAPISGYISERMVDVGALVGPGGKSLLATIVRSDTVMVDFSMSSLEYFKSKDRDVNLRCEDGECLDKLPSYVTITLADGSEYLYRGLVDFADPVVDPSTGTISVRAEMPNPDGCLLPGEKTKVKVLLDVIEGAMTVPAVAVRESAGEHYVFVVSANGSVESRRVTVGSRSGRWIVVKDGLSPGEMVATDRFELLSDAVVVKPVVVSAKVKPVNAAKPSEDSK
ncbi:MAG: efflux RND transporter periplasmic adaptor subunit [Muribaculaceae bacterium]|nr:efflux RND transporter periplasmic adaptor subunit [Muribaculaceae bacterium]